VSHVAQNRPAPANLRKFLEALRKGQQQAAQDEVARMNGGTGEFAAGYRLALAGMASALSKEDAPQPLIVRLLASNGQARAELLRRATVDMDTTARRTIAGDHQRGFARAWLDVLELF